MSKRDDVPFETTLRVRDACLCLHAQRAARVIGRRFDDALRPLGLTNGQFSLLISLNRPHAPPVAPVARLLGMDRTTLTAALKPLQQRGLVIIRHDEADRRERRLHLTPAAQALLARAMPVWEQTHQAVEAALPDNDAEVLLAGLTALSN